MKRWRRLAFYLLLNVLVSACTMALVLALWTRFNPSPVAGFDPLAGLQPSAATPSDPTPSPEMTPTLALQVYQVQAGDTLSSIAEQFGVSVDLLMRLNGLNDPNALGSGQTLLVPATPRPPDATPTLAITPTPLPAVPQLQITIRAIIGAGVVADEHVILQLDSEGELNLAGWRLEDGDGNAYIFPALSLFKGGAVSVFSRAGTDSAVELFWGRTEPIWQVGETAVLRDPQGKIQATGQVP